MEEGGFKLRNKLMSIFVCAMMVVSISSSITQNAGEMGSSGGLEVALPKSSEPGPQNVGQPIPYSSGIGGLADSPWPMFRQNLNHTGVSPYNTSNNNGKLKWSFTTGYSIQASPVIDSDGIIYAGSWDDNLYSIEPDGTEKWNFSTGSGISSAAAIGSDGTIYIGSGDKNVYAINPDGTQIWSFTTEDSVDSSSAIGPDGTIYIGSTDGYLYAINANGTQKWKFATGWDIFSSPAIGSDGIIYVGSHDCNLYAINPSGSEKWRFITGKGVHSAPALGIDGTIYVGSFDSNLYAINPDGTEKWHFTTNGSIISSPAIDSDGTIYIGSYDNNLYAIWPDGTEKWKYTTDYKISSSPAIDSGGIIYIGCWAGKLYSINPDGSERWNLDFGTGKRVVSSPAIGSDGTVYVGSEDNKIYAIGSSMQNLEVQVTSHFSDLNSAAQSTITIHVTDGTNPVQGATVNLVSDNGGIFNPQSGITDANGDFKSIFNAPTVTSQVICRISAEASKTGYNDGSGYVDVTINPVPWPMFRQNLNHTGLSPYDTSSNPGKLKWSFTTGGGIHQSSPAIDSNGTIYIGSYDDRLFAINLDGIEKWNFMTGGNVHSSPAIGSDGTIYIGSYDNKLYAINPDGSEKWSFTTGGHVHSSPAIGSDHTIYVGSCNNYLYAINPDGTEKWSFDTGSYVYSSPAISYDGTIYVGSHNNKLYAINPDSTEKWSFTTGGHVQSSPAISSDGTIYIGSCDNKLYAINLDGTEKWSFSTGNLVYSSPGIGPDGTIYVGSYDNKLYAINPDGTKKWSFITGDYVHSSPALGSDGTIYFGGEDNKLYAINPDGSEKWNFATGNIVFSSPTVGSDGTIYVGSNDNKLYAIGAPAQTQPPIANAGPNQTVNEGDIVQFNGTGSKGSGAHDYWDSFLFGADSFITSAPSDTILVATDYGNGRAVYAEGSTFSQIGNLADPGNVHHQIFVNSVEWSTKGKDPATCNILVVWGHRELLTYWGSVPTVEGSNVTRALEDEGYNVSTSHDVPGSLVNYDAVIIPGIGWSWGGWVNPNLWSGPGGTNTAHKPTTAEITTLLSFIQSGGGLVASVEYEYGADWLQDVGNPMGVYFAAITWDTPFTAYRIIEHPIFLKWNGKATEIISYEWDFESDGIYDYLETSSYAPDGTFDGKTTHTYGDDGKFIVTLRVTDNDNLSTTDTCNVTVQNVDPTVTIESITMEVEIGLRVAGRKYNNVSMALYEDGSQLGYVSIERLPGSPNEQMAWIPVSINFSRSYNVTVTYTPEDPPNIGGNPVWIYLKSKDGTINKIHHTFNVQQSKKRDSEHWNHVEPWEVDLNEHFIGLPFEITSHITDPGSDDETLTFTYGTQVVTITYLNNPPNPDPYPSPEIKPMDIFDVITLTYEGAGTILLVVKDDDNIRSGVGQGSDSINIS
jgi:outer membrane protein assembly factor BamB